MWEGMLQCLKWYNVDINYSLFFYYSLLCDFFYHYSQLFIIKIGFVSDNLTVLIFASSVNKVYFHRGFRGPHNIDIISIIIGSILGDTQLEKRYKGLGTRIIFEQSNKNVEYLMWFHNYFASRGYCNINKPKLHTRIKKDNKVYFHFRVNSYTFSSFNWLHDMFYVNSTKIVPFNIEEYLTPLALAIWFMDGGSKLKHGVRIANNNFTLNEVQFLCHILYKKYNLIATVHTGGKGKGYVFYINNKSVPLFISLVKPYMIPSMYYKIGL